MSFSEDRNSDPTSENVGQDDKVNVEEAGVNLDCVKRELDQEELEVEHKQYKIALTFENVFGESSTEQISNRDTLIGFLDGDVIMKIETGTVKLEEENMVLIRKTIEQSHCNKCGGNYQGYCLNCSSLSHILNNLIPNLNPEPVLNTTPTDILEIREVSMRCAVFALKTLPKGILIGPFEGIAPIDSTTGLQWKMKNKKFVNDQNGNWMKYIESVANHSSKNLDVFQIDGILYFETCREIQEGEELLVCYREEEEEEEMLKTDKEEFYLVPVMKEEYSKVFACTYCCLGFRLERCLLEHKSKCPQGSQGVDIEDFEIIQCGCCRVWLEKEEHLENHKLHCLENYKRLSHSLPGSRPINTCYGDKVRGCGEISPSINADEGHSTPSTEIIYSKRSREIDCKNHKKDNFQGDNISNQHSNTSEKVCKCSECSFQTYCKSRLIEHLNTHHGIKPFECDICKMRFTLKSSLKKHIRNHHSNTSEKEYNCSQCSYQTNYKCSLKQHLNTHNDINPFECDICKRRFTQKRYLKMHIRKHHSNTSEKEFNCCECSYHTNYKRDLNVHLNTHINIKPLECNICKKGFTKKSSLNLHIRNQHSNASEKDYKCSECSYQTNFKNNLKSHLHTHNDIKPFECDICKKGFIQKIHLKQHVRNQHSNTSEKEYKCSKCSFQTNCKSHLNQHFNIHDDIKSFECDICKRRYTLKMSLKQHIRNHHSNTSEKEYKCSECSYQTNYTCSLKRHLHTHNDIKPFECDICKKGFARKCSLQMHIKNHHSNTNGKEYKCSECPYQTNDKRSLKRHLNTHNDIKPFECDICKMRFTLKSSLKKHIRNHHSNTSEKQYNCYECSYQTNYKGSLKMHIRNHHSNTSEKEYKCTDCPYQSNYKSDLNRHLNTHNDIKPFECDICKMRFTLKSSLKKHIKNHHSNCNILL